MTDNPYIESLPEKDYLALFNLIKLLHTCKNRKDLQECFKEHMLPFFGAQATVSAWTDPDFQTFQVLDCVGFKKEEYPVIQEFLHYDTNVKLLLNQSRPVMASDIDAPRENIKRDFAKFFSENPELKSISEKSFDRLETIMITYDSPETTNAIGIHRHSPHNKPWTMRDVRLLELLRPSLLQTIKVIALNEELSKYKSFAETLTNSDTAMAFVSKDARIIFQNNSFTNLLELQSGGYLPKNMIEIIERESKKFEPFTESQDSTIELPFIQLAKGDFRLSLSLINSQKDLDENCWLLKMKPAIEPYSRLNLTMQKAGLSPREMEIAYLVRDGLGNNEIANRLFISLHTVKTHLRNMHEKLGISSRTKLVALLNKVYS